MTLGAEPLQDRRGERLEVLGLLVGRQDNPDALLGGQGRQSSGTSRKSCTDPAAANRRCPAPSVGQIALLFGLPASLVSSVFARRIGTGPAGSTTRVRPLSPSMRNAEIAAAMT